MNKILITASAFVALCAVQAQAETQFGGVIAGVNKTTPAGSEYFTDFSTYVSGDLGKFWVGHEGKENSVAYEKGFGDTNLRVAYNLSSEVATVSAGHKIGMVSFGGEVNTADEWSVWGRYDTGSYFVAAKYNQADTITLSGGANYNGFSVGVEANSVNEWNVGFGYAVDKYSISAGFEHDNDYKFEGGYAINDNLKLVAGYYMEDGRTAEKTKVGLAFTF